MGVFKLSFCPSHLHSPPETVLASQKMLLAFVNFSTPLALCHIDFTSLGKYNKWPNKETGNGFLLLLYVSSSIIDGRVVGDGNYQTLLRVGSGQHMVKLFETDLNGLGWSSTVRIGQKEKF